MRHMNTAWLKFLNSLLSGAIFSALAALTFCAHAGQMDINGPTGSDAFGTSVTVLPNGNFVVTDPGYDIPSGAANVGAVYLYDGKTLALISTLTGSTAGDIIGFNGVTTLSNGNFVVRSTSWNGSRGAVTWGSGTSGVTGVVSSANSLIGSTGNDQVGNSGMTVLSNGNFVVCSTAWNGSRGAVTWGSGTSGVTGVVSSANSLVGSTASDQVGSGGVTVLNNGNYVVLSSSWGNGAVGVAGAVTWGSGTSGVTGVVSSANSLVGSTASDQVGYPGVTALNNGNYVVSSIFWNNGAVADAGAVTWGSGTGGVSGVISSANSLVGSTASDRVGFGVTVLNNGNYVVNSSPWNGSRGAVTWGSGTSGVTGAVSSGNSLVGSTANDNVGYPSVSALSNGNYVVSSAFWDNGAMGDAGAVTWGSGTSGVTGIVSSANSLVGSTANDQVGYPGVTALNNGNFVVSSTEWNGSRGAVTWGSGTSGVTGVVSSANSLVGSTANDQVGSSGGNGGVTTLNNGNYVVRSIFWDNGAVADAGAVTWGSGTSGVTGVVSSANSLVGSTANDYVGNAGVNGVTALNNGNYVVNSWNWDNGAVVNAGAVTWGSGTSGVTGVVSSANSLVGSTASDFVNALVTALNNGNYVVRSSGWDNGAVVNAGAVTWGSGTCGVTGVVSSANSSVGSAANNGFAGDVIALNNGNYVVRSTGWNGSRGVVTWRSGASGATGEVSSANSLVGSTANDNLGSGGVYALNNGNYVVRSSSWDNGAVADAGAVSLGDGLLGVTGAITSTNSVLGTVTSGGNSSVFDFDYLNNHLVVGYPYANRVSVFSYAPLISTQLANQTVIASSNATFSVTATGTSPLTYQWYFNGSTIADGTNNSLTVSNVTYANQGGSYQVIISNAYGAVTSAVATVTAIEILRNLAGADGTNAFAGLVQANDGNFYGTIANGGANGVGTVFRLTPGGVFSTLFAFTGNAGANAGAYPYGRLIQGSDGLLYGTTYGGGANARGTVFKVTTGGAFSNLYSHTIASGSYVFAGLVQASDGVLYGNTWKAGSSDLGTTYKITTNGTFSTLVNLTAATGTMPVGNLTLGNDGNLYGTAQQGGSGGFGTLFKMTPAGAWTVLTNLTANAAYPHAALELGPDGIFYGTTESGGTSGSGGTFFRITPAGVFTTLLSFTNGNGANPLGDLTLGPDGNFYGTTYVGGSYNLGTVFRVSTNGALTTLLHFNGTLGSHPESRLLVANDGYLYGTTWDGGTGGGGVIFRTYPFVNPVVGGMTANIAALAGSNATFSVTVLGQSPFAYQWLFNGAAIAGGTNSSLTVSNAGLANIGDYQVIITNAYGSVTSSVAVLSLAVAPVITVQPDNAVPFTNTTASFSVTATGNPAPAYQWRWNGSPVSGATSSTYNFTATPANTGNYDVVVTNIAGSVTSSVAKLVLATPRSVSAISLSSARYLHTTTLLPNGKVLVVGGLNGGVLASAELFDPATGIWSATGSLNTPRRQHTATLLANGKVLVAGGYSGSAFLASAELYDPATGTWTTTGALTTGRYEHTATLLANGKVLVTGGNNGSYLGSAELYDPASGTWTATGVLSAARNLHTATLLPNGKVLVAAGYNGASMAGAELYDPATGTWTATGGLGTARYRHRATLLPNGKVLITGGVGSSGDLASAELYDPATGSWTTTGALATARDTHTATLLPNGKLLVAGGYGGVHLSSAEVYDPVLGTWTTAGTLAAARYAHTATVLASGRVMFVGGEGTGATILSSAELYEYATGSWTTTRALATTRSAHTTTLLPNGKVLVAGGYNGFSLSSSELYDPTTDLWTSTGVLATARHYHTATLLLNGKVLVAGGYSNSGYLTSTELYDPATGLWANAGVLATARYAHTATLLPNGKVLVAGGLGNSGFLSTAELYDPATGIWATTGGLITARRYHTATLLPNGKVLVTGGENAGALASAELYDSATGGWTTTSPLTTARSYHTATLLPNGKVLVTGGGGGSADLYDAATGLWTTTGALATARAVPTATLLPNGKVLVTGGYNGGSLASAELFTPSTGTWSAAGLFSTARREHGATLLSNGKVLVTGGYNETDNNLASAELFDAGLGFSSSWQPQISTFTSPLISGGSLSLSGSRFRGISGASGGNHQDSSSDNPVVQLRSLESGQTLFLNATNWTTNAYTSTTVTNLSPGWTMVTMFVNGIPSTSSLVSLVSPPQIIAPIAGQTVVAGSNVTFSVAISGSSPLSYQWLLNGTNIAGATGSSLMVSNAGFFSQGNYSVIITNSYGGVTSAVAALIVTLTPTHELLAGFAPNATTATGKTPYYVGTVRDTNGNIWGTTGLGGTNGNGTVFKISPGGTLTTVVDFTGTSGAARGATPAQDLLLASDGNLYGTTDSGGSGGVGTLFRLTTSGTLTTLVDFTGNGTTNKGSSPQAVIEGLDGWLYGPTAGGGSSNMGTAYKIPKAGGTVTTMVQFAGRSTPLGNAPIVKLLQASDGNLYGTTYTGGTNGPVPGGSSDGTIYRLTTNGVHTPLVQFSTTGLYPGSRPAGFLTEGADGLLYGTTSLGGSSDWGTTFKMTKSGTLTSLYSFTGGTENGNVGSVLVPLPDGNLYGVNYGMGTGITNNGTVFRMTTNGAGVTTLVQFTGTNSGLFSGTHPRVINFHSDGNLYGATQDGGPLGGGTVYRLRFGPSPRSLSPLAIAATNATFSGAVNPNGLVTTAVFEWGTSPTAMTNALGLQTVAAGTNEIVLSTNLAGLIPGTTYYYRLRADNANEFQPQYGETIAFTTTVSFPYLYTQPENVTALAGVATNISITATGAVPMVYQWYQGSSPVGGATNATYAFIATPSLAGNYSVVLSNSYGMLTSSVAVLTVTCPTIGFTSATMPDGDYGVAYSQSLTATGGVASYSFGISAGALPPGINLSVAGALTGTPTGPGIFNFTATVTDTNGCTGSQAYSLTVYCPAITVIPPSSGALPAAISGQPYAQTFTASGGAAPYTFAVTAGSLPGVLSLSTNGALTGIPAGTGNYNFTVTATDTNGCVGSQVYGLAVVVPASIVTPPGSFTLSPNAGVTFTVGASGTSPFTYQWRLNGMNISGANGSFYSIPSIQNGDEGVYSVVVCNAGGCITNSTGGVLTLLGLDIHPVLHLRGPVGATYRIDYSDDLGSPVNWTVLTNIILPTSPYLFPDPTPARQTNRFYRAVLQ